MFRHIPKQDLNNSNVQWILTAIKFCMALSICVCWPLLFLFPIVLVWKRAVNRQPGSRARTRRAGGDLFSLSQTYVTPICLPAAWQSHVRVSLANQSPAVYVGSETVNMATSGKPSNKFPLGELEGQEPSNDHVLIFCLEILNFQNNLFNFQLLQKSGTDRTLKFQSCFSQFDIISANFNMSSTTIFGFRSTPIGAQIFKKLLFHSQEYCRAAAPSGPLSHCFGMATSGEPSTKFPPGELEGQDPPAIMFPKEISELLKKFKHDRSLKFQSYFYILIIFL
jgi:hypothetical protein